MFNVLVHIYSPVPLNGGTLLGSGSERFEELWEKLQRNASLEKTQKYNLIKKGKRKMPYFMNYWWVFYYFQIKIIFIWINFIRQHLASLYLFLFFGYFIFSPSDQKLWGWGRSDCLKPLSGARGDSAAVGRPPARLDSSRIKIYNHVAPIFRWIKFSWAKSQRREEWIQLHKSEKY